MTSSIASFVRSGAAMGVITTNRETWKMVREHVFTAGQNAGPDDAYLARRGLRIMAVRLERHQSSALAIAEWLASRSEMAQALRPALPNLLQSFPGRLQILD